MNDESADRAEERRGVGYWIGQMILGVYALGVLVFGLYYNYEYANEHGFLAWVMFGEVIATAKSLFWPILIFIE